MIKIFGLEAKETYSENIGLTEWRVNIGEYCGLIHFWKCSPSNMGKYHWHLTPPYPDKLIDAFSNSIEECVDLIQRAIVTNYKKRIDAMTKMIDTFNIRNKDVEEYVESYIEAMRRG